MLTREIIGAAMISLVFAIALFVFIQIRGRRQHQERNLSRPDSPQPGEELFRCLYVATVFASSPLDRVWAYGLGVRGKARVVLGSDSLSLVRQGEESFSIPLSNLVGIERSGATIDRGVEARGLIQFRWLLGDEELITSIRITNDQEGNFVRLVSSVEERR